MYEHLNRNIPVLPPHVSQAIGLWNADVRRPILLLLSSKVLAPLANIIFHYAAAPPFWRDLFCAHDVLVPLLKENGPLQPVNGPFFIAGFRSWDMFFIAKRHTRQPPGGWS